MMATINPLGERARGNVWWRTAAAFAVGCILGGLVLGGLTAAMGTVIAVVVSGSITTPVLLAAALVLFAGVVELGGWSVPTLHRQVDKAWVGRYRGWVYGGGFGVQLGAGLTTTVTTSAVYATVSLAVLLGAAGRPGWALVIGGVFGLTRAAPLLGGWTLHDPESVRLRAAQLASAAGAFRLATGSCLGALAMWAAATL